MMKSIDHIGQRCSDPRGIAPSHPKGV